jgi:putative addiction module CopG family antidote
MAPDPVLSITLPKSLERFAREQVESGLFDSVDEVVREALKLLEAVATPPTDAEIAALRAKLDQGVQQADAGHFVTFDEALKRIGALREKRR